MANDDNRDLGPPTGRYATSLDVPPTPAMDPRSRAPAGGVRGDFPVSENPGDDGDGKQQGRCSSEQSQPQLHPQRQRRDSPQTLLEGRKASRAMVESLQDLRRALLCPLCSDVFRSPATSSCGHSFCESCIDAYSAKRTNDTCPVDGCKIPISMSSRGKSFRQHNPALETVAASYANIVEALRRRAPDGWWDVPDPREVEEDDDEDADDEGAGIEGDAEEMIDLSLLPAPRHSLGGSSVDAGTSTASGDHDDDDHDQF